MDNYVTTVYAEICGIGFAVRSSAEIDGMKLLPMLASFPKMEKEDNSWTINISQESSSWFTNETESVARLVIFPCTNIEVLRKENIIFIGQRDGTNAKIDISNRVADIRLTKILNDDSIKISTTVLIEILRNENVFQIHCAAIKYNGRAILLVAPSGGGKTTLACVWAAIGNGALMADDRCLLVNKKGKIFCQGILGPVGFYRTSEQILSRLGCYLPHKRRPGQDDKILYDSLKLNWQIEKEMCPVGAIVLLSSSLHSDTMPSKVSLGEVHKSIFFESAFLGNPDILQNQFDMISNLVNNISLMQIPSRPNYPGIINGLERTLGGKGNYSSDSKKHPLAPVIHKKKAHSTSRVLCSILLNNQNNSKLESLSDDEWKPLLKLAEYHSLLPLLGYRLRSTDLLNKLSSGLRNVVKSALDTSQASRMLHLHMINLINHKLTNADISWCVMKGPAISERVYDPPEARIYSDLDIIIPYNKRIHVQELLKPLGLLSSSINQELKNPDNRGESVLIAHEPNRYVVELHWDYITGGSLRRFVSCNLDSVLARKTILKAEGIEFPATSISDQLVSCCIHAAYGHQWNSLRQLLDIILILQTINNEDITIAMQIAKEWGVINAVHISIERACTLFNSVLEYPKYLGISQRLINRILKLVASDDMTIRPWLKINHFRSKLARTMLKLRCV